MWKKCIVTILIVTIALSCCGCVSGRIYGKSLTDATALDTSQGVMYLEQIVVYMMEDNLSGIEKLGYAYGKSNQATFDEFWEQWQEYKKTYGGITDNYLEGAYSYGDEPAFVGNLIMESGDKLMIQMHFSHRFELYSLFLYESPELFESKTEMPEGIEEIDVIVGEGTSYELPGKITRPIGAESGNYPAAVLVPGDGANTMDMAAGNTYLYRDLAWELAQKGIVTIRYEKRTLTYKDEALAEDADKSVFTVNWEYTDDANLAAGMLAGCPYVNAEQIYYVGHSQSAQVGCRADKEAGGLYAGFVLINSSPRYWYDVIYDQYINYGLVDREYEQIYYLVSKIKTERSFIAEGSCSKLKEEELTQDFILSRAAAFWVDYLDWDYVAAYRELEKPMLILQGEANYQIVSDVDYAAWQKEMGDCSFVSFRSFEGLNHLMMPSEGIFFGHYKEFDIPHTVGDGVVDAIAEFMK